MRTILLFGAGKSATVLIHYLLTNAAEQGWQLNLVDADLSLVQRKIGNSPRGRALSFDIKVAEERQKFIEEAALVISLLPPHLHSLVAQDCVLFKKNLLTASYIDESMKELESAIDAGGLLFLCEMGLDPGIDHMSARHMINSIEKDGGVVTSFLSHCGGLTAPESDDNPWRYKVSWNPRNVVMAGKTGAVYQEDGNDVHLTCEQLFAHKRNVSIPQYGDLCWYPNRDSVVYQNLYGLMHCPTFIRTTLRHGHFITGWNAIVQLKLTDETVLYETNCQTGARFFREHVERSGLPDEVHRLYNGGLVKEQLQYLGFFDEEATIDKGVCSAADVLQSLLEKKLFLKPGDRDMVIMMHEIKYRVSGKVKKRIDTLIVKGTDGDHTAMAKTVGLPLGIAAKLVLNGVIKEKGLRIPLTKGIYEPVLKELAGYGINFHNKVTEED